MIRQLVDFEQDTKFSVDGAQLAWSPQLEVPFITADSISYIGTTGDVLRAEKVTSIPVLKRFGLTVCWHCPIWTMVGLIAGRRASRTDINVE